VTYLMIEALQSFHHYYGDDLQVELPTGSGHRVPLDAIAADLSRRLVRLFLRDEDNEGRRPVWGDDPLFQSDAHWRDYILFYEYFHAEKGAGLGASHQTGWTALVANLIRDCGGRG
jgi:hypothetical protein